MTIPSCLLNVPTPHASKAERGDRAPERRPGREYYAYNVCALSAQDFDRLREVLSRAFGEIRSIVAVSSPEERVARVNLRLLDLARV